MRRKNIITLSLFLILTLGLTACTSDATNNSAEAEISIVTSTNVYGQIAETIAGKSAKITAIINSPTQDPHSYEATASDKLAVSKANIVIQNGGGYDSFMKILLRDSKNSTELITAVELFHQAHQSEQQHHDHDHDSDEEHDHDHDHDGDEEHDHDHDHDGDEEHDHEFNEHVWYDLPTMIVLAENIKTTLKSLAPQNSAMYENNTENFIKQINNIQAEINTINTSHAGAAIAVTEILPLYLIESMGLINKTPVEFSNAIEFGNEVPLSTRQQTINLFTEKQVKMLFYNKQTTSQDTQLVLQAAKDNKISVISVTETLPENTNFIVWMSNIVANVTKNLVALA